MVFMSSALLSELLSAWPRQIVSFMTAEKISNGGPIKVTSHCSPIIQFKLVILTSIINDIYNI